MTDTRIYMFAAGSVGLATLISVGSVTATVTRANADIVRWEEARRATHDVQRRLALLPVSAAGAPSPDHIAILARRLLVTAGVGQDALAGIQPLGDATLPGGAWHRQQVLLQLRSLTTSQAGAIVAAVTRTDPAWTVTSIQLTHVGQGDTYDAGLALTTLYPATP